MRNTNATIWWLDDYIIIFICQKWIEKERDYLQQINVDYDDIESENEWKRQQRIISSKFQSKIKKSF